MFLLRHQLALSQTNASPFVSHGDHIADTAVLQRILSARAPYSASFGSDNLTRPTWGDRGAGDIDRRVGRASRIGHGGQGVADRRRYGRS